MGEAVTRELRDRMGNRYQMVYLSAPGEAPTIVIKHANGTRAAHVRTRLKGEDLEIRELHVEKAVSVRRGGFAGGIATLFGGEATAEVRRNGFGTILVESVAARARALGARQVVTHLGPDHVSANPHLVAWFGKRGFEPVGTMAPGTVTMARPVVGEDDALTAGPVLGRAGARPRKP